MTEKLPATNLQFTLRWTTPKGAQHYYLTPSFTATPAKGEAPHFESVVFVLSDGTPARITKGTVHVLNSQGATVDVLHMLVEAVSPEDPEEPEPDTTPTH